MVNKTLWKVIRTWVDGSTLGNSGNAVSIKHATSPVMIGIFGTYPTCGLNGILQVANTRHFSSPGLVGQTQKLDAVIDRNFPDDLNSASIFNKVISHKLSDSSSGDFYTHCRMNFEAGPVQTQTPQLMDLGFSTINALDEISGLSIPNTGI